MSVSNISSSVASSVSEQTLAALQAQMALYANAANGKNPQAKVAYTALQSAIQSGNISQAQAALAKLQQFSRSSPSQSAAAAPTPADTDGDNDANSGAVESANESSLDKTA
jgi:hypothetical protein